ncbi:hypothetical protein SAMN05661093_01381 [Kibdelosporangium aridum]|uniref:Uncharacterized protein n=2 Tax=Kibdelosporangium aridum TaxID=2030 RepID=A0A1Y5X347_KIBAR|nr:hypothetical protein SAMN05661093_01381 [Kibdelosporangium aridum]
MTQAASPEPTEEFQRFQLQQAIETVRHQTSLMVQLTGFCTALDSALLAYGIVQGKAILVLMAAVVPLILAFAQRDIVRHVIPFAFVALQLESALQGGKTALITTYVRTQMPRVFSQMEPHLHEPMDSDFARTIRRGFWNAGMRKAMIVIAVLQLAGFALCITVFRMKLV